MRKVVVTGATGLVGSHLVRALEGNWEVFAVSRTGGKDVLPPDDEQHRIRADFAAEWNAGALPKTVDAVVHLAQAENYREFPEAAESMVRVNTLSTVRLLDYARKAGAKTFVLASSGGLYGSGDKAFREDDPVVVEGDLGFYLRTRRAAEILAAGYGALLSIVTLRFFFVYGKGQRGTMLLPRLVKSVREGSPITLQGTDGIRLNPIHVDDAVRAVTACLYAKQSQLVNVAGPEVLDMRAIGRAIGTAVGREPIFKDVGGPAHHLVGDIERLAAIVRPSVRFEDGVKSLL